MSGIEELSVVRLEHGNKSCYTLQHGCHVHLCFATAYGVLLRVLVHLLQCRCSNLGLTNESIASLHTDNKTTMEAVFSLANDKFEC